MGGVITSSVNRRLPAPDGVSGAVVIVAGSVCDSRRAAVGSEPRRVGSPVGGAASAGGVCTAGWSNDDGCDGEATAAMT